jgi:hypothetical protein
MCKVSSPCHYARREESNFSHLKRSQGMQAKNDEEFFSTSVFSGRPKARLNMIADKGKFCTTFLY